SLQVLGIRYADSRVPESVATAYKSEDIFDHDTSHSTLPPCYLRHGPSELTVSPCTIRLSYAITAFGVQHVLVVGHTHCGGAAACMSVARTPSPSLAADTPLGRWLAPLTSIASSILEKTSNAPLDALVEENVRAQVANLSGAPAMQDAWEGGKTMSWIHELGYKI
ncbi:hypothetical protein FIBSPDRAFT_727362, partial [Athelia psychrophila]